jgi:hypothetical protein
MCRSDDDVDLRGGDNEGFSSDGRVIGLRGKGWLQGRYGERSDVRVCWERGDGEAGLQDEVSEAVLRRDGDGAHYIYRFVYLSVA